MFLHWQWNIVEEWPKHPVGETVVVLFFELVAEEHGEAVVLREQPRPNFSLGSCEEANKLLWKHLTASHFWSVKKREERE